LNQLPEEDKLVLTFVIGISDGSVPSWTCIRGIDRDPVDHLVIRGRDIDMGWMVGWRHSVGSIRMGDGVRIE
jgi:hypothetical protein